MTVDDLSGTVAIVTGAGRGIGKATALGLARRGAALALCSRTASELDTAVAEVEAIGGSAYAQVVDVADQAATERFVAAVTSTVGRPRLLVNNAAVLGPVGRLGEFALEEWHRTLRVNVGSVVGMCAAVVPHMRGGAIVNLSGGGIGGPAMAANVSAYTTSKAAIVAYTEALAAELADDGITVNAIAPGAVATTFMDPVLEAGPERAGKLYAVTVEQQQGHQPVSLDSFVDLIAYLAAERGRRLTGKLLSARWDSIDELEARREEIRDGSLYALRRIDGALYAEVDR